MTTENSIDARQQEHQTIQWCLLSHTNIGKTSLARTLLTDDVGQIQDAAHITNQSQRHLLQHTDQGDALWLWDTPGFGDSARLYHRLQQQRHPLGWFLSHVWDRWRDKPFYMSQRALLAARDHADIVLYLVNAVEDPADAGYWTAEMRILQWMGKPVLVLLNQIGSDATAQQITHDLQRWRTATQVFADIVQSVQVLDAFTRSWWHERQLMESVTPLLPVVKQAAYQRLLQSRSQQQQTRETCSLAALAAQLVHAATLQESAGADQMGRWQRTWSKVSNTVVQTVRGKTGDSQPMPASQMAAMQRLAQALQQSDVASTQALLQLHSLDGEAASEIQQQLEAQLDINTPLNPHAAGLWGALSAGAASGLGADMLAGGMTLGTGALVGALVGAIAFAGAAWGTNKMLDQTAPQLRLSPDYLTALASQLLLKYLVISHFGRGRGRYSSPGAPRPWVDAVQTAVQSHSQQWQQQWKALAAIPHGTAGTETAPQQTIQTLLDACLQQALRTLYPDLHHTPASDTQ